RGQDAVGNFDLNSSVTVYDYKLTVSSAIAGPGSTVRVELRTDRNLGSLQIYSVQYTLQGSSYVTGMNAPANGLIGTWSPANLFASNAGGTRLTVAAAGAQALGNGATFHAVDVTISPAAPLGTFIPLMLTNLICNEGRPVAQVVNGGITVQTTNGVGTRQDAFALTPPLPNPCRLATLLRFVVPQGTGSGERASLAIHGLDGRLVRTLVDAAVPAGAREAIWDGRDDAGSRAAPGIYFLRLDWAGRQLTRRLVVLR